MNHRKLFSHSFKPVHLFFHIVVFFTVMACGSLYEYENQDTSLATIKVEYQDTDSTSKPKPLPKKIPLDRDPPQIEIDTPKTVGGVAGATVMKTVVVSGRATDPSGIVHVLVNGQESVLDSDGRFDASALLSVGMNRIQILAMDPHQNTSETTIRIARTAKKVDQKTTAIRSPLKFYALVIGNNNYYQLAELETAVKDARDVARILGELYGFQVQLLLDADRSAILSAVNAYRRKLTTEDSFLLYYAGHGIYDKGADRAYWLPVDAVLDDDTNWIIADTITSNLKRLEAAHILVVADSCYSGTLTRGVASLPKVSDQRDRYLNKMLKKPSRTLIASGGNEPVSDSGGAGNSIFAKVFLDALQTMEHPSFTAEELFYRRIREQVAGNAAQTPQFNILQNSGHDGGDFVFFKNGSPRINPWSH